MKHSFTELKENEQLVFGDGCSFVPDFIFTASCRHHDFNYSRGGGLLDKLKADYDMCRLMWSDSNWPHHYLITILYYLGLTFLPFPYLHFTWGGYRSIEDILTIDKINKKYG